MLSVKKILAGRGAVDYYLNQTRRGLADYYLPGQPDERAADRDGAGRLSAPGSSWWGSGAEALGLGGEVERREFVPLYAKGVRPGGGYLGRRFRQPEEAAAAKAEALLAASEITEPYERWMAKHELWRKGGHASVAAWDCTFSPPKSVSLLWAAGDADVQRQVWAAHTAAVEAGLVYLERHAGYVRAGAQGVRVLDTSGLVVARMNEWTSRDGDMHIHTHCLILNRAQTVDDGKWRALDGRALLARPHRCRRALQPHAGSRAHPPSGSRVAGPDRRAATDQWLRHVLTERGMADALDDPEWPSLVTTVRHAALAGHDPDMLLDEAIRMRPIDDAHSTTAILHWRLGVLAHTSAPSRLRGPLASLPRTDGPCIEVARQAGELMRQRWRELL